MKSTYGDLDEEEESGKQENWAPTFSILLLIAGTICRKKKRARV